MEGPPVLVIGLGSVLMQDEGIGVRAVEELESRYNIPEGVEVVDGGTSAMDLLRPLRNREHVIIADAVNTGAPPGTLVRLGDDEVPAFFQTKISNHQLALSDLLATLALNDEAPRHITVIGMVPHLLENRLDLSPQATEKLDDMVAMLVDELKSHGFHMTKRSRPLEPFWGARSEGENSECA